MFLILFSSYSRDKFLEILDIFFLLTKWRRTKTQTMLNRYPLMSGRKYWEALIMTKCLMGVPRSDELPPLPEPQEISEDESSESRMWEVTRTEVGELG